MGEGCPGGVPGDKSSELPGPMDRRGASSSRPAEGRISVLKTLLVPLDGSALSEQALPYATALARRVGARVVLVRAILAHTFPGVDPTDAQIVVRKRAEADLEAVAERLGLAGLDVETHVYYDEALSAILDAVKARHADLIVMATHGRTGLGRWVYGSIADRVLRHAPVPVFLVPATVSCAWTSDRAPRLLVPLDGSVLAEAALAPARELATDLGGEVVLMRVVESPASLAAPDYLAAAGYDEEAELAAARGYLNGVATALQDGGVRVEVVTSVGHPPTLIPMVAHDRGADLIVMATHGRSGLARLVLGSVGTGVLQRSAVPVLLTRPAPAEMLAPAANGVGPTLTVTLTASELELVTRGLELLQRRAGPEVSAERVAALAARLRQTERPPQAAPRP